MNKQVAIKKVEQKLISAVLMRGKPDCFPTKSKYKAWLEVEAQAPTNRFRKDICEDCKAGFKSEMVSAGRCVNPRFRAKTE